MLNLLLTLAVAASPQTKPATNTKCPVLGGKVTEKSKTVAVRARSTPLLRRLRHHAAEEPGQVPGEGRHAQEREEVAGAGCAPAPEWGQGYNEG